MAKIKDNNSVVLEELTQDEIIWLKKLFSDTMQALEQAKEEDFVSAEVSKVANKYKEKLDKFAKEGEIEKRKLLIEVMSKEAKDAEKKARKEYKKNAN